MMSLLGVERDVRNPAIDQGIVVVVRRVVVSDATGARLIVVVVLSAATPLVLRYVVDSEALVLPSGLMIFWVRWVAIVPGCGACNTGGGRGTDCGAGATVVVVLW
jgi:hypothetical protein